MGGWLPTFFGEYCGHVAIFLAIAALTYWMSFRAKGIPTLFRIAPAEIDQNSEAWLHANGYTSLGTYQIDFGNAMDIVANFCLSADRLKSCSLYHIRAGVVQHKVIEFSSRCEPFFILCMNNYCGGEVLQYPPFKLLIHSPAKNIAELNHLHEELLDQCRSNKVNPAPFPTHEGSIEQMVCNAVRRDFEYQVRIGRMKRVADDVYRPTLWGALIGTPIVWLCGIRNLFTPFLPRSNRRASALLDKKLQEFWNYPQSAIDFKY